MEQPIEDYPFRSVLSLEPLIDYLNRVVQDSQEVMLCQMQNLQERLRAAPELNGPVEDLNVLERHRDLVRTLMGFVFPPLYWDTEAFGAIIPFSMKPFFVSPRFQQLFLDRDGSFHGRLNLDDEMFHRGRVIRAYLFILQEFYDIHQSLDYPIIRIVPDSETGLDRHFKMNLDFRFVRPHALKEPRPLTEDERAFILEHLTEPEVLREILPPEDFELHGFTILHGVDVTESEVLSALERDLIDQESVVSQGGIMRLQERLRTLFRRPDLIAGLDAIQGHQVLQLSSGCEMSHCCIFQDTRHIPISEFEGTFYEKALQGKEIIRIPDIREACCSPKQSEEEMLKMGIRSFLIAPLYYKDELIGILHLGSPRPRDLGPVDALLMQQIQPLFSIAIKKALDDFDVQVQGVIKEKCTAIHPSVEWRFRKAAFNQLEDLRMGKASEIEPIVFNNLYPLYGISDIRGSAQERNRAIQKDLIQHLNLALKVVSLANEARPLLILQELAGRVNRHLERLHAGLGTGDELSVSKFLREEVVHSFSYLKGFGPKVMRAIEAYESAIDPHVGTVYSLRKEFEESVYLLSDTLATYLDQEQTEAQAIFPHYFERHRTDGVDYLIYMGASLREDGNFNQIYLKNLRLWQLKVACGMAWHTEQLKSSLKVPLDTAHLILVQDTPLSIRFRYDEKRFDVDGAYDIRHEIIKSRLDKAVVKGGRDRLTQPGKIAIVYAHPEEAKEMRPHIEFLQSEGYLTGELETVELADLPGVQGLKSFRVGVNLESQALSEKAKMIAS
ncbi:MAG: GAF domain-containing protein [Deltaproteobacteria bacterium]|nr:MAG: GAF domain-containing protein [Deltaproteobacteria bacterium]